ncbi:MAG: aminoglycoside phosphotransferase [Ilumatobacteraceae bacterium]|nr:aminoglycoside phosphotransferase [Ilumatobacteraceae bacterium]
MTPAMPGPPPGRSAAVAHRLAPDVVDTDAAERPITVDQTNISVVVGEAVVVKWLQPPVTQPYGTVTMLRHLAAAGFDEMPHVFGPFVDDSIEVDASICGTAAAAIRNQVQAMVTAFVPGALDGWDWYVDELTTALDAGDLTGPLASASALGALAARLHRAFATPTEIIPTPVSRRSVADEHARGIALLDEALRCTRDTEGERLRRTAALIRAAIEPLASIGEVPVQHVHGDLHVGQILRSPAALVVNDFDGNPIAPPGQRHLRRSAMVDLASLVQSVDHVGRIVARRRPELAAAVDAFIADAVERVQTAYRAVLPAIEHDDVLLVALRAIQELHELVYAATSLPRWLYVPDAAIAAMFPEPQ